MYVANAYGTDSYELAHAVWRDQVFEPMHRFSDNENGRAAFQCYLGCLLRWNVIKWKPNERPMQKKVTFNPEADHFKQPRSKKECNNIYNHGSK
jgi:hypothetical protein